MSLFRCGGGNGGQKTQLYPGRNGRVGAGSRLTVSSPVLNGNGRLLIFATQVNSVTSTLILDSGSVSLDTNTVTFKNYNNTQNCLNIITYSNAIDAVVKLDQIAGRVGIVMMDIKDDTPILTNGTSNQTNHDPVSGSGTIYWIASSNNNDGTGVALSVKNGNATLSYGLDNRISMNQNIVEVARYDDAVNAQFAVSQNYCMVIVPD